MQLTSKKQAEIKALLGREAALMAQDGMLVGLGTGSTADCLIDSLITRCKNGLKINAVSSSLRSLERAQKGGIPVWNMDEVTDIDLTIDGADEVDPEKNLIKGKGGALLREKILASTSRKMVVIVDEGKLVKKLGMSGLPVEILAFGYKATINKIEKLGFQGALRKKAEGSVYFSDNGNYIFDIQPKAAFVNPKEVENSLIQIPGVIDTGFFFKMASEVLVGYSDGRIEFLGGR